MAYKGRYSISPKQLGRLEVTRAAKERECWGAEVPLPNGKDVLITHSGLCDGMIHVNDLYLQRPDRRDPTCVWRISMYCAAQFHSDELEGDLVPYLKVEPEVIEAAKQKLLHTMQVLGGNPNGEDAASKAVAS